MRHIVANVHIVHDISTKETISSHITKLMAKKTPPNSASIGLRHLHLQLAVMELVLGVED